MPRLSIKAAIRTGEPRVHSSLWPELRDGNTLMRILPFLSLSAAVSHLAGAVVAKYKTNDALLLSACSAASLAPGSLAIAIFVLIIVSGIGS